MKKLISIIVALVIFASVAVVGVSSAFAPAKERRHIVGVKYQKPKKNKKQTVQFTPPAMGGYDELVRVEHLESNKWGGSFWTLHSRIGIESTWNPAVGCNSSMHCGLGQFAPSTFERGLSTMPRKVVVRKVVHPKKWIWKTRYWSDGTISHKRYKKMRVNRYIRKIGYIPQNPPIYHMWAQVRIMAQAIVGKSAVSESEWTCCE